MGRYKIRKGRKGQFYRLDTTKHAFTPLTQSFLKYQRTHLLKPAISRHDSACGGAFSIVTWYTKRLT
jgi:hypothetical protein